MKNTKNLYAKICDMDNLRLAHKNAKRGKGWYAEVQEVDRNIDYYLSELQDMLVNHTYKTSPYKTFIKEDGIKRRTIYKLPYFPDRICQWAILQIIEPFLIKTMTTDTYSAIPCRGAQPIINKLRGHYKTVVKNGQKAEKWIPSILISDEANTKYCLKLDIRKYYPSILHSVLKAKFRKLFKDKELIELLDEIIDSISTCPATEENFDILRRPGAAIEVVTDNSGNLCIDGVGIPIGNYLSQYDGNFNLAKFDHWLKEVKKVKYYFRYMDDIVILGGSKEELHTLLADIFSYMEAEKLVIKNNYQIFPTKVRGIDFVGYRFFGEYTLLRKHTCKRFKRKMLDISAKREKGITPTYSEWCAFNAYKGWLANCDSYRLCKKYVEPNIKYMEDYYLKEVKGNAEIHKGKEYRLRGIASGD